MTSCMLSNFPPLNLNLSSHTYYQRVKYQISPSLLEASIWSLRFKKYQNDHRLYIPFVTLIHVISSLLIPLVNV